MKGRAEMMIADLSKNEADANQYFPVRWISVSEFPSTVSKIDSH
jgi:hypothetical protein